VNEEKEGQLIELPFLLSNIALDSALSIGLSLAKMAQIMSRSVDAGIEKHIELMESEMKTDKEKVKVE
jgi:type II secretory pathway component PulC